MKIFLPFLLLIPLFIFGCKQTDTPAESPKEESAENTENTTKTSNENAKKAARGTVLARVNGEPIYSSDLGGRPLQYAINEEILYQDGLRRGIDKEHEDMVRSYKRNLVIQAVKRDILDNAPPSKEVSDEDIENYYNTNIDKYTYLRVEEITFPEQALGEKIIERASKGEPLDKIAADLAGSGVAVNDLGFDKRHSHLFPNKETGQLTKVIRKPDGNYSVLKILEARQMPMQNAKRSIQRALEAQKRGDSFQTYVDKLIEENSVEIEMAKGNQPAGAK